MIKYLPSPIHPGGSRLHDKVRIVFDHKYDRKYDMGHFEKYEFSTS